MPKIPTASKGPDELPPAHGLDTLPLGQAAATKAAPAPAAHHPRGMSGWPAILACPCYEAKGDNANAAAGTAVHAKLAGWLEAYRETGTLPEVEVAALSMHEAGAYKAAQWIVAAFGLRRQPPERLHVEYRCTLPDGTFGTADAVWIDEAEHTVHVVDFKTFCNPGRDYMPQLAGYGLAVATALLRGAWSGQEGETMIDATVLYGDRAYELADSDLIGYFEARDLHAKAMAAYAARDAGTATPTQCNWCELCAHHAACPAVTAAIETLPIACAELAKPERPDTLPPQAVAHAPWSTLPAARKAQLLVVAEFAAAWAETVKAKAKEDALAGMALADPEHGIHYTLRESRGRLKPRVADLWPLLAARGVTPEAYKSKLSITAANAEALLREVGLTAKAAKELIADVSDVGKGSVSLVRA